MKNTIIWICRILLALVWLILFYAGFMWAFVPETNLLANSIVTDSILWLNMIKSDIWWPLMWVAILWFLFLYDTHKYFIPMLIFPSSYLVVRSVSFVIDGSHETIIAGLIMEAIVVWIVILLNKLTTKK